MALSDDILTILLSYSAGYRRMRESLSGAPPYRRQKARPTKGHTLYLTLARLKKRGLVTKEGILWKITAKGRSYLREKSKFALPPHCAKTISARPQRNMIIAFDIPEKYRRRRDWLRAELSLLGFSILQKSVWFGPARLPKDFISALNMLHLLTYVKFFEAKEKDIV